MGVQGRRDDGVAGRTEPVDGERPTVLVVDDDRQVANLHARALTPTYEVRVAYCGQEALDVVDRSVDVVLLDRKMPDCTGEEVLAQLRASNVDCRVAMVTAVEPCFDVIDVPFDDYVEKPVTDEKLRDTVRRLLLLDVYRDKQVELSSKQVTRNVLRAEKRRDELADNEEFARLEEEIMELKSELRRIESELGVSYVASRVST